LTAANALGTSQEKTPGQVGLSSVLSVKKRDNLSRQRVDSRRENR
jgi:hypothetical protein